MSQPSAEEGEDDIMIKAMKGAQHSMLLRFRNPLLKNNTIYNLTSAGKKFNLIKNKRRNIIKKIIEDRNALISTRTDNVKEKTNVITKSNDKNGIYKSKKNADFLDVLLLSRFEDGKQLSEEEI